MQAYILLNCQPTSEKDIIAEIRKLPQVLEVNGIMGIYDILVKVGEENPDEVDLAIAKVRGVKGIDRTYTMPVIYGQGGTIDEEG